MADSGGSGAFVAARWEHKYIEEARDPETRVRITVLEQLKEVDDTWELVQYDINLAILKRRVA